MFMSGLLRIGLLGFMLCHLLEGKVSAQGNRDENAARKFGWLSNYQEGLASAKKSGKPIMLVFRCIP
jgi:hypothetical protein